jgi:hypothetical protein
MHRTLTLVVFLAAQSLISAGQDFGIQSLSDLSTTYMAKDNFKNALTLWLKVEAIRSCTAKAGGAEENVALAFQRLQPLRQRDSCAMN